MRSIRTHSGILKKKDSFTDFRTSFSIEVTENYVPFTLKFHKKTTFLVWERLRISIQKYFIVSEKLVTKDTQPLMKDKCSTCLKLHLHPAPHSKMAPEPCPA